MELMVGKLNRLPSDTQEALKQFACMGNSAEFEMLAMAYEKPVEELHQHLGEAVRTGRTPMTAIHSPADRRHDFRIHTHRRSREERTHVR
jgi:hypothetical protein